MAHYGRYRNDLTEEWTLEDLYVFPRAFEQIYFFLASLDQELSDVDRDKFEFAYKGFPWQGGYSAVSFFNQLKFATKRRSRPAIIAIQKASPGYFDLGVWISTALSVAWLVKKIASTIDTANTTYNNVYKGMQERKLLKLRVQRETLKFNEEEIEFINDSCQKMAKLLGFSSPVALNKLTGNPYLTVKILLSAFRRARTLADYENKGKAHFTEAELPLPVPSSQERGVRGPKTRLKE
jgi:hypothetical protein